jgi:hypothetical protein
MIFKLLLPYDLKGDVLIFMVLFIPWTEFLKVKMIINYKTNLLTNVNPTKIMFWSLNWILHNNAELVDKSMEDIKSYMDTMFEPKDTEMQVNGLLRCLGS